MPAVVSAVGHVSLNLALPEIEILLDVEPGSYSLGPISVPTGLKLLIGDGADRLLSSGDQDILIAGSTSGSLQLEC